MLQHVCICVHVYVCMWGCWKMGGVGYILVMLTEFYKLWLTPLPTADWILNKQSQVDESRGVSAQAGEALLLTSAVPPPRGPHIGLSYFWQLQWRDAAYGPGGLNVVCFRVVYKGESPKEEGEVDGRKSWREWGKRKLQAGVCYCAAVGWKSLPATEVNWVLLANFFLRFWGAFGGIRPPPACLSESDCECKAVCQSFSLEHHRPSCLISNCFSYLMFSHVTFHVLGCVPYPHEQTQAEQQ